MADPTCKCGHSVVKHHFHGTNGCRVCNCGAFRRAGAPSPKVREEREEESLERPDPYGDCHPPRDDGPRADAVGRDEIHRIIAKTHGVGGISIAEATNRVLALRTHSPEEPVGYVVRYPSGIVADIFDFPEDAHGFARHSGLSGYSVHPIGQALDSEEGS